MNRIKTFEEACKALELDPNHLPEVSMLPEKHRLSIIAYYKLVIIIQALNNGWEPDWFNTNQYKYYNWFYVEASEDKKAGFGFHDAHCVYACSRTYVGSRLCFETRDMADYAAEQFKDLYQEYLLLK